MDVVNSPPHYQNSAGIECIEAIEAMLEGSPNCQFVDFCRASAMQYIWRLGRKGDVRVEAGKARWYINRLIDFLETNDNHTASSTIDADTYLELDERADPKDAPQPIAPTPQAAPGVPPCKGEPLSAKVCECVGAGCGACGG